MTPETAKARRGLFTASQNYRLMGGSAGYVTCEFTDQHTCYERIKTEDSYIYVPMQEAHKTKKSWKKDNTFLPDGADKYIIEKVAELKDSVQDESYTSAAMQYGIDTEPMAIEAIQAAYGITLAYTNNEQFFFNNGEWGATPDGVEYDDDLYTVKATHEVKCPNSDTHTFNCLKVFTAADLEKHYTGYYWQVISQLESTGATVGYWHSYRPSHDKPLHTVTIDRDDAKINTLKHRLRLAVERKYQYLETLK
ncbi:MAG: hypothetical protein RL755_39 [Pseudomonadota bacterium]|jgi:hypothetical protein